MFDFIIDYYPMFLKGTGVTILLALLTVLFGTLIGVLVSITRFNNKGFFGKILNKLADVYIAFFRGTPLMIQLFIFWFGIPQLFHIRLKPVGPIPAEFIIGAIALAINSGAYVAEIFRSGIMSIDIGQNEAGRSLGFNYAQTMIYIIVPQAFKNVIPTLGNEFIVLLKETAVCGYIGLMDLTRAGDSVRAATYNPYFPLIFIAVIYLVMVMFFTWLLGKLERRLRNAER